MSTAEGVVFWGVVAVGGTLLVGFVAIGAAAVFFAIRDELRRTDREQR
jgi:hypothetical protein